MAYEELKNLLAGIKKDKAEPNMSEEVMSAETAQINAESQGPNTKTKDQLIKDQVEQEAAKTVPGQIEQSRDIASVPSNPAPQSQLQKLQEQMTQLRTDDDAKIAEARDSDRNRMMLANAIKGLGTLGQAELQRKSGVSGGIDKFQAIKGQDTASALVKDRDSKLSQLQNQLKMMQGQEMSPYQKAMLEDRKLGRESREKIASEKKRATPVKLSVGEEQVDKEFGKKYSSWNTDGRADYDVNKKIFSDAIADIKDNKVDTGFIAGVGSKIPGVRTNTAELQSRVQKAINGMLRATLGSQFTEKEGQRIFNQTFDPSASEDANVENMELEIAKLDKRKEAMEDMGSYFKDNKTMSGYEAKPLSEPNYTSEQKKAPSSDIVEKNGKKYKWNPRVGKYQKLM
jgi:hypothetical protein